MIAPKWIAEDGKSFWLVYTDFKKGQGSEPKYGEAKTLEQRVETLQLMRKSLPYYRFNWQRVDLIVE